MIVAITTPPNIVYTISLFVASRLLLLFLFLRLVFLQRLILAWDYFISHEQLVTRRDYLPPNKPSNPRHNRVIANTQTTAMTSSTAYRQQGSLHFRHILLLRLVNALTMATFFQPDEYFQALEPAYKVAFGTESNTWVTWVRNLSLVQINIQNIDSNVAIGMETSATIKLTPFALFHPLSCRRRSRQRSRFVDVITVVSSRCQSGRIARLCRCNRRLVRLEAC